MSLVYMEVSETKARNILSIISLIKMTFLVSTIRPQCLQGDSGVISEDTKTQGTESGCKAQEARLVKFRNDLGVMKHMKGPQDRGLGISKIL